jgi:hypothetical protein
LVKEIHPTRNINIEKILDLSVGSHVKVIWYCPKTCAHGCEHVYEMVIRNKVKSKGCKYCTKELICEHDSFGFLYPDLVQYWHPTKNENKNPYKILPGTHDKVWWICNKATCGCIHEYIQEVRKRITTPDCLYCSKKIVDYHDSIDYLYPEKMKEWYYEKNNELGYDPKKILPNSQIIAYWKCLVGCKYKDDPPCHEMVNQEECQHIFQSSVQNRIVNNTQCTYCIATPQKICYHQSIDFLYPELAKEWDHERNGDLKPYHVSKCSDRKVHWKCHIGCQYKDSCNDDACHHRWISNIANRTSHNRSCPYCVGGTDKVCFHQSLAFLGKEHLFEWDYEKNDILPENISYKSNKSVHWKCKDNHSYMCIVNQKVKGTYCPECKYTTEKKLMEFLVKNCNYTVEKEKKFAYCKNLFTNYPYRFDFYIEELNVIIELDGLQHFTIISNWEYNIEISICKDVYKMKRVNSRNIRVIRLLTSDVYGNKNKWEEKLLSAIYNMEVCKDITNIYICNKDDYAIHQKYYNEKSEEDCLQIIYEKYKDSNKMITYPHLVEMMKKW